MLLSDPERPSPAAALDGTTAGEVVAVPPDDVPVTTVVAVVPDATTLVSFRVHGTVVDIVLADVEGSVHEVEVLLECSGA